MTERARPDALPEEVQDLLDAYVAAVEGPSVAALAEWIRRYPRYERELTEFTVAWSLSETLPPAADVEAIPAGALAERGLARVREILEPAQEAAIDSLSAAGTARGLSIQQLAQRTGLSLVLLRMLDRRLIRFSSIPREAIDAIAGAIGHEAAAVARYLQRAPTLAPGASYYAEQAPRLAGRAEQEDFFEAVRDDPDLDDEQRERWLALAPSDR